MDQVTIYGRSSCGFCVMARRLCESMNLEYVWVDMIAEGLSKEDIAARIGHPVRTVPQILIGQRYIGGYDEFSAYVRSHASELAR
ncbi:GrxA family glutaredoxin [Marinobacter sp. C2H3]|uniref:GrxA family glutaredoxin n=1 Tax=Marinobacter sp. C2H3 TaxID=3119003 RepID=UPI00300F725E